MNNILLLSPFFFPEPISTGKYNTILAKELALDESNIDVFCSHPIYPNWRVEPTEVQLDGIKAKRGGRWLRFPKNVLLRRAVLEIWFLFFVLSKLVFSKKKYTHVVPIFPPSLFMLIVPFFVKEARLVGIVHDLQGVYAKKNSGKIKKVLFSMIKWVEQKAFKSCDKLIFLSEDMMRNATSTYGLDSSRNFVHYPFITINDFKKESVLANLIPDNQISIVYSGALGEKQAPHQLARFMETVVSIEPSVKAYIFSQGPEFENLKEKFSKISFHSLVTESNLPELLLRSTVQILPQAEGTSDGSLPSKLPNLLASGCKIFCITDHGSELVKILNSYSKSKVCHNWDISLLSKECIDLINDNKISVDDFSLLEKFRIQSLIKRIVE